MDGQLRESPPLPIISGDAAFTASPHLPELQMKYSEGNGPWQEIATWIRFLLSCGYAWDDATVAARRITLISMPCDSAAAGLIALGAMRRRLAVSGADELQSHFQRIERLATEGAFQTVLRHQIDRGRFFLRGKDKSGMLWVERDAPSPRASDADGPLRKAILPELANAWMLDGEAPVQVVEGDTVPYRAFYEALVDHGSPVFEANLRRSDSAICLAGRAAGEVRSRAAAASLRFQIADVTVDLGQLLTIQGWSDENVSRMAFFNTLTGQLDRQVSPPRLVVADGDAAFLRVIDANEFRDSHVVGVIHRAIERDRLEEVGVRLAAAQSQWYVRDDAFLGSLGPAPPFVTVLTLRRK